MSTEQKPLTAEGFVKQFFGYSYCTIGPEERENLHAMLDQYAAHQTAAKDTEIAKLRQELESMTIRVRSTTNALIHIANAPAFSVDAIQDFATKFLSDIVEDVDEMKSVQMELAAVKKDLDFNKGKLKDMKQTHNLTCSLHRRLVSDLRTATRLLHLSLVEIKRAYHRKPPDFHTGSTMAKVEHFLNKNPSNEPTL